MTGAHSDGALLKRIALFQSLGSEVLDTIAAGATRQTYCRGAHIPVPKGDSTSLCLVISGALRVYRLSSQGQEITLAVLGAGRVYGLSFLSPGGLPPNDNVLQAVHDDTMLFHVPCHLVEEIMDSHPSVARCAMDAMGETLIALSNRVEDLGLHDVKTRLARALAHRVSAETCCVTVTHAELATEVGTRREEVSRVLAKFRRQGIVQAPLRGVVVIADRLALAREARITS